MASPTIPEEGLSGRILGDFVVGAKLDAGGFGTVYVAEQRLLGREAVIKVLHHTQSDEGTQRFLREARLASTLDHPFAAHIYAFGAEPDGLLWIAMERVRGTTLQEVLKTQGPLPLHRFVPFFEKLCEVVHTAHSQGIVHRDLKPANVMVLSRAGKLLPKLLDLGIAKLEEGTPEEPSHAPSAATPTPELEALLSSATPKVTTLTLQSAATIDRAMSLHLTQANSLMGSPHYMAPEQWVNGPTTPRTDIYALGFVAYQCLVGKPPFPSTSVMALAAAHAKQKLPPLPKELPPELDPVLAIATAKKPSARFATALELAQAIRAASHLTDQESVVPQLVEDVRNLFIGDAPQPVAEAVALLEAARHPARAVLAIRDLLRVITRYVGTLALSARARIGPGGDADSPAVQAAFARLHAGTLDDLGWWQLATELVTPFVSRADAHPIPDLVGFLTGTETSALLPALWKQLDGLATNPPDLDTQLRTAVGTLGRLLGRLSFLQTYGLRVRRGDVAESWMGLRRVARPTEPLGGDPPGEDQFFLASPEGGTVLSLHPLLQAIAPTPGAVPEPFFLSGSGRHGAKMIALPVGFERQDETLWRWFSERVAAIGQDATDGAHHEATPYLGLAPFTSAQSENFFGREREAEAFANRLRIQALLGVVGPSGAGKSSFIQAGVLPLFPDWRVLTVRPGTSPFHALVQKLAQEHLLPAGLPPAEARALLDARPALLGEWLRHTARGGGRTLMLVVDQFEELITLCTDVAERQRYAQALVDAALSPEHPVRVVLTFRDDFLIRLQQLTALREKLGPGLQLLGTPSPDDLLRILVKPAALAGHTFEDEDLPQQMVHEVESLPGALALLSFTASKLWELRDRERRLLTRKAYLGLGGVGGALGQHAEATLTAAPAEEKPLVREAFRHLVTAEGTRAVLSRKEMNQLLGGAERAGPLLERLIIARLLVTSEGEGSEDRVEVIHEALLASWPRLVQWQREDAENVRMRDALRAAARQWSERGKPRGLLWRGEPLVEYKVWRGRYPGSVTETEAAFAGASLREEARGRNLRRGLLVGGFTALLIVLAVVSRAQRQAARSAEEAKSRLAALRLEQGRLSSLDEKPLEAAAYLESAHALGVQGPELRYLLERSLSATVDHLSRLAHDGTVMTVTLSPDERVMVSGGADRKGVVWSLPSGNRLAELTGHTDGVHVVRFSPDGTVLATGSYDGTIRLWNASSWTLKGVLTNGSTPVFDLDFSPDGKLLAVAAMAPAVTVWDTQTSRRVRDLPSPSLMTQVRFSPNGRLLTGCVGPGFKGLTDPGVIPLWEVTSWKRTDLKGHAAPVRWLTFSPDGQTLATASEDRTVRLWSIVRRTQTGFFLGHTEAAVVVAFSPDGSSLISGGADNSALLWNLRDRKLLASLRGHSGPVTQARFTPDGKQAISASDDGTARLWDASSGSLLWKFVGHVKPLTEIAVTRDGQSLITAGAEGFVKVWPLHHRRYQDVGPNLVAGMAPSAEGDRLLVVAVNAPNIVEEWSIAKHTRQLHRVPMNLIGLMWSSKSERLVISDGVAIEVLRFPSMERILQMRSPVPEAPLGLLGELSADGDRLALAHQNRAEIELWDVTGKRKLAMLKTSGKSVAGIIFSAAGLLAATDTGAVEIWRPSDGVLQRVLPPIRGSRIRMLAGSPDGRFVAAGNEEQAVVVWDVQSGGQYTLDGTQGFVQGLGFSPDSTLLAAIGSAPHIQVWETSRWESVTDIPSDRGQGQMFFLPSGDLITSEWTGRVRLWDLRTPASLPADLAHRVQCRIPYRFSGERLVQRLESPPGCEAPQQAVREARRLVAP